MATRVETITSFIPIEEADPKNGWVQTSEIPVVKSQINIGKSIFRYLGFEPLNIRAGVWPNESESTLQGRIRVQMISRLQMGQNRLRGGNPALNTDQEVTILSQYFTR